MSAVPAPARQAAGSHAEAEWAQIQAAATTSRTTRHGSLPGPRGRDRVITADTHRQRMRTVRAFFERIIEWDWPEAPPRNPVIADVNGGG